MLMTGLPSGYQEAGFAELAGLGDDVLVVHPPTLAYTAFQDAPPHPRITRWVWDGQMPDAATLLPVLDGFAPDAIVMTSWHGRGYRAAMRAWRGRALRVMFSSNFWRGTAKQYAGLAVRRVYVNPLFDCVWVPGERAEMFARQLGFAGRDIIRGANAGDTGTFDRGPRSGQELAGRRQFLFVGRLIWHKAPAVLARAYAAYRSSVEDPWDLVVAGDGPLRSEFDGVDGVKLLGFVQPGDLAGLMHESSCLVLPSYAEWYGVVIHEASAAGLPLICSDGVGAVAHFLQDGFNGWTVAAGDQDELTDALRRMSTAPADRLASMSEGGRALSRRLNPRIWALNLHEQLDRRLPRSG